MVTVKPPHLIGDKFQSKVADWFDLFRRGLQLVRANQVQSCQVLIHYQLPSFHQLWGLFPWSSKGHQYNGNGTAYQGDAKEPQGPRSLPGTNFEGGFLHGLGLGLLPERHHTPVNLRMLTKVGLAAASRSRLQHSLWAFILGSLPHPAGWSITRIDTYTPNSSPLVQWTTDRH